MSSVLLDLTTTTYGELVDDALAAYAKARDYRVPSEAMRSIVP